VFPPLRYLTHELKKLIFPLLPGQASDDDGIIRFTPPGRPKQERRRGGAPRCAIKRVSFAPPGRREQEQRQGGRPRRAIKQDAQSNLSTLRRPDNANKSRDRGAHREAILNESPSRRPDGLERELVAEGNLTVRRAMPKSDHPEPEPECANGNKSKRQHADGTELKAKCGHTEGTDLEPEQDAEGTAQPLKCGWLLRRKKVIGRRKDGRKVKHGTYDFLGVRESHGLPPSAPPQQVLSAVISDQGHRHTSSVPLKSELQHISRKPLLAI